MSKIKLTLTAEHYDAITAQLHGESRPYGNPNLSHGVPASCNANPLTLEFDIPESEKSWTKKEIRKAVVKGLEFRDAPGKEEHANNILACLNTPQAMNEELEEQLLCVFCHKLRGFYLVTTGNEEHSICNVCQRKIKIRRRGYEVMHFGKYNGTIITDMRSPPEITYLKWLLESSWNLHEKARVKIQAHLNTIQP